MPALKISFGLMLQFYDKVSFHTPLVAALAFAALGQPASAAILDAGTAPCELSDGYASNPADFVAEVGTCIGKVPDTGAIAIEAQIAALSERHRAQYGLEPQPALTSLGLAARAHAMDMAARGYASHESPEGLGHLDRLRRLDRSTLFGAMGANIGIFEAGTTALEALNTIISDPVNSENLRRENFSHFGVGVARAEDGALVVVQLFVSVEGFLEVPMPLLVGSTHPTAVSLTDNNLAVDALHLASLDSGRTTSVTRNIVPERQGEGDAGLEVEATLGARTFTFYGPVFTIEN